MIIVKLMGGMGNQMFQYALYQALLAQGKDVKLDRAKFTHIDEKRKCFLDYDCFSLRYELCTKAEARNYILGTSMAARVLMRILGDRSTHYYEKAEYEYDASIMELEDGYLDGFWQSWKYFQNIEADIKKQYSFENRLTGENKEFEHQIQNTNSVGVHIRRGDYLKLQHIYGNICTANYYARAIDTINEMIEQPIFYFFSNDIDWTRLTFGCQDNFVFVKGNKEDKGYIDMELMSKCKHQIIANSSFSWWAAFLNNNPDKRVICPSRWINTKDTTDVYCYDWIKLNSEGQIC